MLVFTSSKPKLSYSRRGVKGAASCFTLAERAETALVFQLDAKPRFVPSEALHGMSGMTLEAATATQLTEGLDRFARRLSAISEARRLEPRA